ncbi:beta-ketoacyl-ACP synthase 3 [Stenotrophomonas maltophilia]|uniref:beta-ketoacyl-ACP synthase 3 n=1 Tax=Stenotrophomonas maltophilia TaxID=40324 RepID=UPI002812372E|nr:beta-ketoacyl-ACP synthase 3 [Stenotrophomonas maltophilia]WMR46447.1 beta-ketoacyl-ACP synthase 3 [Stenotrophomonas maltophilia]
MTETTPALDRNARNWTLASAALALLPLLLQLPPLLAGVIAAAALVTAALSWRKVLPMPVRLLLVLAMLGAIAWQMGMVRPGRDTGCALLAAMLAIKSSELRSRRDARSLLVFALGVADKFIRSGDCRHVLVIGTETLTRMVDWNDRTTCVLFGDGAGAVVLKADEETGILSTHLHADGSKKELLWNPVGVSTGFKDGANGGGTINMKGNDVFKYAVKALDSVVDETLAANGLDKSDLDWLIPHQANLRIIEATAKRLDMSMDQVVVTVDKHGNTSSGSVPLALDAAVRSGRVERGQLLLLEAFGGGFTWGSALLRY